MVFIFSTVAGEFYATYVCVVQRLSAIIDLLFLNSRGMWTKVIFPLCTVVWCYEKVSLSPLPW